MKSFDDLVALVGVHGFDAVSDWLVSFNVDATVGAELEASCRDDLSPDVKTVYTPEFEAIIVLVSSPLALLVALWGMTPKSTLQLMESSRQESAISLRLQVHQVQ